MHMTYQYHICSPQKLFTHGGDPIRLGHDTVVCFIPTTWESYGFPEVASATATSNGMVKCYCTSVGTCLVSSTCRLVCHCII